jgi:hypothetical protein
MQLLACEDKYKEKKRWFSEHACSSCLDFYGYNTGLNSNFKVISDPTFSKECQYCNVNYR